MAQPQVQNVVQELAARISHDDVLRCIRCGLCAYTCPTYRVEECESMAPRGRLALVRAVIEGKLELSPRFAEKFFDCVLCAACTSACPSGTKADAMLLEARHVLFDAGLVPEPVRGLLERLETRHNISGEENAGRLVWCSNMEHAPAGLGRSQAETVYFVGCVGSLFPMSFSIPQAFSQTLDLAGVEYALLGGKEWCCGYPAFISGDVELAGGGDLSVVLSCLHPRVPRAGGGGGVGRPEGPARDRASGRFVGERGPAAGGPPHARHLS
ncbi:MAG: (Fe-S)-binding protein [Anaerolineae bacterium]|nr:(Fe-S)-binding protein [Anaerolineae bacterium]